MFTILGADGREYGPVTIEQIKSWISEGRANLDSKVKAAGSSVWVRIGDSEAFNAPPADPAEPPLVTGPVDATLHAETLIARAQPLDIFGCFERSWELLKDNFWLLAGSTALFAIICFCFNLLPFPNPFLESIISTILGLILISGLFLIFLKRARKQPSDLGDLFSGFTRSPLHLTLCVLVSCLFVFIGACLLILPGIYLFIAYIFPTILIIDKKMDFWPAMEISRKVVSAQWWRVLGLFVLSVVIACLGVIGFGIGVFVTLPIAIGAVAYAYEDLCNPKS